jgi:hypothetical protein
MPVAPTSVPQQEEKVSLGGCCPKGRNPSDHSTARCGYCVRERWRQNEYVGTADDGVGCRREGCIGRDGDGTACLCDVQQHVPLHRRPSSLANSATSLVVGGATRWDARPILHLAGPDAVLAPIVRDMFGAAGERATQCTGRAAGMIARRWGLTTSVVTPLIRQVSAALVTIMLEVCCDAPPHPRSTFCAAQCARYVCHEPRL